jgi:cytochrome bd-type quinol oxidase subunit 2
VTLDRGGTTVPLVRDERAIYTSTVPPPPRDPPMWVPWFGLVGLAIAATLLALARLGARSRAARAGFGALLALIGLPTGVVGLVIPLLWGFTNHRAAHLNWNLLVLPPWTIAFVVLGIAVAVARRPARWLRAARVLASASAATTVLALLIKALPAVSQSNGNAIALLLPVWAAVAFALSRPAAPAAAEK